MNDSHLEPDFHFTSCAYRCDQAPLVAYTNEKPSSCHCWLSPDFGPGMPRIATSSYSRLCWTGKASETKVVSKPNFFYYLIKQQKKKTVSASGDFYRKGIWVRFFSREKSFLCSCDAAQLWSPSRWNSQRFCYHLSSHTLTKGTHVFCYPVL